MSHPHDTSMEHGAGKKTLASYIVGFLLCLILTFIAFGLVKMHVLADVYLYISLAALAIIQLFVQTICFLRLNASKEGQWNLLPFLFVILIIAVFVGGTLWIMYNLNYYMYN